MKGSRGPPVFSHVSFVFFKYIFIYNIYRPCAKRKRRTSPSDAYCLFRDPFLFLLLLEELNNKIVLKGLAWKNEKEHVFFLLQALVVLSCVVRLKVPRMRV